MSRIGKAPIDVPKGVEIKVEGRKLTCKGPLGSIAIPLFEGVTAKVDGGKVLVERSSDERTTRAMHGTTRALVANAVEGVTKGYKKSLEIVGVGYKAVLQGKKLALNVGFANTITVDIPEGVKVDLPDPTHVHISGPDKYLVGQTAAAIREQRKPEPYKGKGVRYSDEVVRRKAGKAAAGATAKK
jgi:large subunit ribosomal protein L6